MPSTQETGHAKNIANFLDLIAFVTAYGATYNPTKASLKLTNLTAVASASNTALADVIVRNTAYNNNVNARMQAFDGLKALSTRLVNSLITTDATTAKVADAKTFNRKIQGQRASKPAVPADPNVPAPKTISSSQQSYDQLIQHFAGIISVLSSETSYAPNEADLKIATLTAKQTDLNTKNLAVATAYTAVSNTRISRDKALYKPTTGLVAIALEVKAYVKAVYGATSLEYKQVKGIPFKIVKL